MRNIPLFALSLALLLPTAVAADAADSDENRSEGTGVLEYGIGITHLSFPHYPGADEGHAVTLPFPYLTYYSETIELDGGEVLGRFWKNGRWSLDLSTGGALPVDADSNEAREGMSDLSWLAEVGPALRYTPVWTPESPEWQYRVSLPLRQAIELDGLSLSRRGLVMDPNIQFQRDFHVSLHQWEFQARLGVRFASREYHQHFYGVPAEAETPERPAFEAEAGLNAYTASMGLGWRHQSWWIGGFIRYDDFSDSVVKDSPLMRDHRQQSIGISAAYIFGRKIL